MQGLHSNSPRQLEPAILTSKVRASLRLSADGDEFTGVFLVDVFDPNGVLLGSDTGNVMARRIKVEPLP